MTMTSASSILECSLCFEDYNEDETCPRMLSCGHTYCDACMRKLLKDGRIECPLDRVVVCVKEGVHSLPKNFSLLDVIQAKSMANECDKVTYCEVCDDEKHVAESFCMDCDQFLCHVMAKAHVKMQATKHHSVVPASAAKKTVPMASALCSEHKEPYRYFDSVCKRAICMDCFALSHTSHECLSMRDAAVVLHKEIVSLCEELQSRAGKIKVSKKHFSDSLRRLEQRYHKSTNKVKDSFDEISSKLLSRKDELLTQVQQCYKHKSSVISEQLDLLETTQTCYLSSIDLLSHASQSKQDIALVLAYSDISLKMRTSDSKDAKELSVIDEFLEFSLDAQTIVGMINSLGTVCDLECIAEGPGLMYSLPGLESTFVIRPQNRDSIATKSEEIPFMVDVQSKSEEKIPVKLRRSEDGTYRATFSSVNFRSEKLVSIRLHDVHINGSPFKVPCFYEKFENVVVSGKFISKSTMDGWNSSVESARLRGVGLWWIFVNVDVCNADVSGFTVSFQDERTLKKDLKKESFGRDGVVWANPKVTKGAMECFVDFNSNSCGVGGKVGTWQGFVKLCIFVFHKGNRFWVDF